MHRRRASLWTNIILSVLFSAFAGVVITAATAALFSLFVFFFMDSLQYISFFSYTSLILGALFAGFICGKRRRRNGLKEGILCGAAMYVMIFIGAVVLFSSVVPLKKLILLTISGAFGGVMGVNSRRPDNMTYN